MLICYPQYLMQPYDTSNSYILFSTAVHTPIFFFVFQRYTRVQSSPTFSLASNTYHMNGSIIHESLRFLIKKRIVYNKVEFGKHDEKMVLRAKSVENMEKLVFSLWNTIVSQCMVLGLMFWFVQQAVW